MKRLVGAITAAVFLLASGVGLAAQAIDLQNPGLKCGVKGLSDEAKIERNRRLAEFYFQAYGSEAAKSNKVHTWADQGCIAKGATLVAGTYAPSNAAPPLLPLSSTSRKPEFADDATSEMVVYWQVMPDFGTVPGTLEVYPSADGVFFRMVAGGHTSDGKFWPYWEVDYIRVNDEGKITRWEFWNDTAGLSEIFKFVFGKEHKDLNTMEAYGAAIKEKLATIKANKK